MSAVSGDRTQNAEGGEDYWIIKVNSAGNKEWDAAFGGMFNDELSVIQTTGDGGYMLAGRSESDISGNKTTASKGGFDYWLVKVNSNGTKQWEATFGGDTHDYLQCMQPTNDGGFIVGGLSYSGISGDKTQENLGNYDYWVVKIDGNGVKQWDAGFGGVEDDRLYSIVQSADGSYMLAGKSRSDTSIFKTQFNKGEWDYWIIKVNNLGIKLWDVVFGGNSSDELSCMIATADDGYMLGGYSYSDVSGDKTQPSKGNYDYWVVKTAAAITLPLQLISFSGIINNNDAVLTWQAANEMNTSHFNVQSSSNGRVFINAGEVNSNTSHEYSYTDKGAFANDIVVYYRLQKVNKDGSITYSNIIQLEKRSLIVQMQVYPNPVVSSMTVSIDHNKEQKAMLQIINSNGMVVKQQAIQLVSGRTTTTIDAGELPKGVYFIVIRGEGLNVERKFIKQ